ncbi:MAG: isoprenylcysteine carboxylmethyltransferase family protein [Chloroflexi bacterium]|nr:isoprenylcysteine carboxylmethyltransferase family protein [Chloroflexota bacterium]
MRLKKQTRQVNTPGSPHEYPTPVYWILFAITWALAIGTVVVMLANYRRLAFWNIGLYAVLLGGYLWAEKKAHQAQAPAGQRAHEPLRYALALTWWMLIFGSLLEYALWPTQQGSVTATGAALMICGSALRVWSVYTLGQYYSGHVETWKAQTVIQAGPYRLLRHPGYAGNILQILGLPLVVNAYGALVLSAVLVGLFVRRLLWEEEWLSQNLAGYTDYRRRTWRLIPGIW